MNNVNKIQLPDTSEFWVSRDPFGGWVYWQDEDEYRDHEDEGYCDGRPANECEQSLIAKMRPSDIAEQERVCGVLLAAIERNTPPRKLS